MDKDNHSSIERWNSWILQFAKNYLGKEKLKLQELHWHVFRYFRDLFTRWYKDYKEKGESERSNKSPQYKRADQ